MKTFTVTGALTAVALCLALPGAAMAQQQKQDEQATQPSATGEQQPGQAATPGAPSDQGAAKSETEEETEAEAETKVEGEAEETEAEAEPEGEAEETEAEAEPEGEAEETEAAEGEAEGEAATETASAEGDALIGQPLYGAEEESFGKIKNVLYQDGKVHAVIIGVGGFLGMGAKTVAVPIDQISVEGDRVMAAGLTRKDAEALPEWKEPEPEPQAPPAAGQGGMQQTPGAIPGAPPPPAAGGKSE